MRAELGDEFPRFIECYEKPPVRGLRVNTLKISPAFFRAVSPWELEETGVIPEGFIAREAENVGRHPFHAAGLFYMQEPSAMSVIRESTVDDSGMRVLDLCAAPGGKSGGIAARMAGKGVLVSNEIIPKRAALLSRNLERLGVTNAAVISAKPEAAADALPGFFDVVLVDAPCSGEGMFRKDETAVAEWSGEHVSSCAVRQSLILESAEKCVADGGALVYSTCTFSREENEGVIEGFLAVHKEFSIEHMERLYPHTSCGEGHFVCRMRRGGSAPRRVSFTGIRQLCDGSTVSLLDRFLKGTLKSGLPDGVLYCPRGRIRLIPCEMPEAVLSLHPISVGVELGELRRGRMEPSHSFFMAAAGQEYVRELKLAPGSRELSAFMSGNTTPCPDEWSGYAAVSVEAGSSSFPIGFGKAVGGVMKNHLPKGLYVQ